MPSTTGGWQNDKADRERAHNLGNYSGNNHEKIRENAV
ncbi:hypothetical protein Q7O_003831 [Pectobacterium carotovorum subsp. carotovorum PCCS1]|nr:hypothetical protein [Pectobacterium carotovorum subsp. carotovorum PCCS1]